MSGNNYPATAQTILTVYSDGLVTESEAPSLVLSGPDYLTEGSGTSSTRIGQVSRQDVQALQEALVRARALRFGGDLVNPRNWNTDSRVVTMTFFRPKHSRASARSRYIQRANTFSFLSSTDNVRLRKIQSLIHGFANHIVWPQSNFGPCGPAPGAPIMTCPDGVNVSGPGECICSDSGDCGWEWLTCPGPVSNLGPCGPAPGAPVTSCADGIRFSGPGACVCDDSGHCGWEWSTCPE